MCTVLVLKINCTKKDGSANLIFMQEQEKANQTRIRQKGRPQGHKGEEISRTSNFFNQQQSYYITTRRTTAWSATDKNIKLFLLMQGLLFPFRGCQAQVAVPEYTNKQKLSLGDVFV